MPGIATLVTLIFLVWLGNWQMQRLSWKEGLITKIEQRAKAKPVSLTKALARWVKSRDVEYLAATAQGRFEHDKERHYFTSQNGRTGWYVYTPLRLANGKVIMVNRGFVTDKHKSPGTRPAGQKNGTFKIVGLLRQPGKMGMFTPDNAVAKNEWFWRDLTGMLASVGIAAHKTAYPFFLDAGAESRPQVSEPRVGATRISFSNKHLGYALTWYGLALTLIGVFAAFAWPRLKQAKPT